METKVQNYLEEKIMWQPCQNPAHPYVADFEGLGKAEQVTPVHNVTSRLASRAWQAPLTVVRSGPLR